VGFIIVLFFLKCVSSVDKGEFVIELNQTNWKELIENRKPDQLFLVEFFSHICGACKKFAPEYALIGDYFRGLISVGRYSVDKEADRVISTQYDVNAVPTVILFPRSTDDKPNLSPIPFEGSARTPESISKWVVSYFPAVLKLESNPESLYSYLCTEDPHEVFPSRFIILFKRGGETGMGIMMDYRVLAQTKKGEAVFAEMEVTGLEDEIKELFNVSSYPAIIVAKGLHGQGERYGVYNENWLESLKEIWDDIDEEVLHVLKNRAPLMSLQTFSIFFMIISISTGIVFCFYCQLSSKRIHRVTKTVSDLTNVVSSWDNKDD